MTPELEYVIGIRIAIFAVTNYYLESWTRLNCTMSNNNLYWVRLAVSYRHEGL